MSDTPDDALNLPPRPPRQAAGQTARRLPPGADPRLTLDRDALDAASYAAMPQVGRASTGSDNLVLLAGMAGLIALGGATWFSLGARKPAPPPAPPARHQVVQSPIVADLPPVNPDINPEPPKPPQSLLLPQAPATAPAPADAAAHAPAMIIDNSVPAAAAAAASAAAEKAAKPLNANDQFVASQDADIYQKAQKIGDPAKVVPQGAVIPAVLETAINSDLPGYTRAIVSRDIRSFDGTTVLIPRGSRLVGQYKSGLASGETRAFIIWSRLIRPDGVSVSLASPGTDDLGQAGMTGKVDSHFAKRFGSAILLSVVNGLSGAISGQSGNTIVIGTSADAQGVVGDALSNDAKIPPTIKVPQGAPIQVFVARDLDFNVGK